MANADQHHAHSWGYGSDNGPHTWAKVCPQAGGSFQSPINIDTHDAIFDAELPKTLRWSGDLGPSNIINTGHGFQVKMKNYISLSGGPLSGDYAFQQFHLHWGKRDGWGSEHTLDGRAFPAELHIVHKKQEYRSMDEALKHKDGVAVVGFFFDLGAPNVELAQVISSLQKVQYKDDELEDLQPVQFTKFLPTAEDSSSSTSGNGLDYYTYDGSLTTPPCSECVTWIVMARRLTLSADQLELMRQTYVSRSDEQKVRCVDNFRPPCPLGSNRVLRTTVLH